MFTPSKGNTTGNNSNGIPDNKKAVGFVNIYVPTEDGGRRKLGTGIPLRQGNENEAKLAEWLANDPDGKRIALLTSKLIIEYNSATPAAGSGFDLSE